MSSVLVCGGTRQQGMSLVNGLVEQGYDVTIANRHDKSHMFDGKVKQLILDRTDENLMREKLKNKRFDIIIDTCAYNEIYVKYLLENIKTDKYIQFSSNAVYDKLEMNIKETFFDGKLFDPQKFDSNNANNTTGDANYQLGKRNAEKYLYNFDIPHLIVRIPYVSGRNDCSHRISWFVEKILKGDSFILRQDCLDKQFAMTHESEAGKFIQYAINNDITGVYNTASEGTISIMDIIGKIERTAQKYAKFQFGAENRCHYNTVPEHSMNTDKAKSTGYKFMSIDDWLWDTIDFFVEKAQKDNR